LISHLEAGHGNPQWETIKRLCAALNVTTLDLAEVEMHFDYGASESVLNKLSPRTGRQTGRPASR
jgi:transcriptional regulator with XRE-family HTH domain